MTIINPAVADHVAEREEKLNTINVLTRTAKDRGGDPTDQDLEVIKSAQKRIRQLDNIIDVLGTDMEMADDVRSKLERTGTVQATPRYRTAGELLHDAVHAEFGNPREASTTEAKRRYDLTMKRAAQHMGTTAENTVAVAGGFGGLHVVANVGPVIDIHPAGQPLLTALGKQTAPNALNFNRPRLVDPDFKTGAGIQSKEKAELESKKFDVKSDVVELVTVGGYLNVSQQLMAAHAGAWDIIVTQLQRRVAWQGEAAGVAELQKSSSHVDLLANADAKATLSALFDAAAMVLDLTNEMPTWIAYGTKGWAKLGKLTDTAGRPLFPFLGAANAFGSASLGDTNLGPLGLRQIVTPGIDDDSIYIGNSYGLEVYSYPFPVLDAVEPSVLGRQVAVAEALAFYRPATAEGATAGEGNGAVHVGLPGGGN